MSAKPASPSKASPAKAASDVKSAPEAAPSVLDLLEEDDEFEEFDGASWTEAKVQADVQALYIDNWDDDDADDDFTKHLRAEIEKAQK